MKEVTGSKPKGKSLSLARYFRKRDYRKKIFYSCEELVENYFLFDEDIVKEGESFADSPKKDKSRSPTKKDSEAFATFKPKGALGARQS